MRPLTASTPPRPRPFISYSANAEDVILHRLFGERAQGFYVDVGAAHPTFENDMRALYDQGWNGINIEPNPEFFSELATMRLRDRNFQCVVSDEEGTLTYWEVVGTGLSTCDAEEAARAGAKGFEVRQTIVQCSTLAHLLAEAQAPAIDVLKVDVEGFELRVLQGNDWTRYRPSVVVVEVTYPETPVRRPDRIRPFLEQNGYDFAYFDGLNDFFVDRAFEIPDGAFLPPNVFDRVVPYTTASLREHAANLERTRDELTEYVESLRNTKEAIEVERNAQNAHIANLERTRDEQAVYIESLRAKADALEEERDAQSAHIASLEWARDEHAASLDSLRAKADALEAERDAQSAHVASLEQARDEQAATLEPLRVKADALEVERDAQSAHIASLEQARDEQAETVGALTDRVRTLEAEYTEQVNQAGVLRHKVEQAGIDIARHEHAAEHLRKDASKLRQESGALRARAMRDHQEVVQALDAARIYGERQLVLRRELERAAMIEARLHASVARHIVVLTETAGRANRAETARQVAQADADELRVKLGAVHASTSWRVSRPLRGLGRLLGRK